MLTFLSLALWPWQSAPLSLCICQHGFMFYKYKRGGAERCSASQCNVAWRWIACCPHQLAAGWTLTFCVSQASRGKALLGELLRRGKVLDIYLTTISRQAGFYTRQGFAEVPLGLFFVPRHGACALQPLQTVQGPLHVDHKCVHTSTLHVKNSMMAHLMRETHVMVKAETSKPAWEGVPEASASRPSSGVQIAGAPTARPRDAAGSYHSDGEAALGVPLGHMTAWLRCVLTFVVELSIYEY